MRSHYLLHKAPFRRAGLVTVLVLAGSSLGSLAWADDTDPISWSLAPAPTPAGDRANYAYDVEPGQEITDGLVVTNSSTRPLTLAVYAKDALTTADGQIDLLPAAQASTDAGNWITPSNPTIELAAGAQATVPFAIKVPLDAAPGDHAAGIITSIQDQAAATGTVTVDRRLALRVYVRVSGQLDPAVAVRAIKLAPSQNANPLGTNSARLTYQIVNIGNVRLIPTEAVRLAGPFGWQTREISMAELPELLPGNALERQFEVTDLRLLGRLNADIAVSASATGIGGTGLAAQTTGTATATAIPWTALALLLLVAGTALILPRRLARRAPNHGPPQSERAKEQ